MDLNRLFSMLTRMVIRSAVQSGIDVASRRGKPEAEMTPDEKRQAKSHRQAGRRVQQALRMFRRIGR
jgi:hypothetical protein